MVPIDVNDNTYRRNYKQADNINFLDGDIESQINVKWDEVLEETSVDDKKNVRIDKWNTDVSKYKDDAPEGNSNEMYRYGESSLISDRSRVFGGSWKDRAYC